MRSSTPRHSSASGSRPDSTDRPSPPTRVRDERTDRIRVLSLIARATRGLVVGAFWLSNSTEQQRRRAREAAERAGRRVKESRIGKSVDDNASKVASATSDRVVDAVDSTGDALADSVGGGNGHTTN